MDNPELITAMGRVGRELAVARFDRTRVIEATVAIYQQQLRAAALSGAGGQGEVVAAANDQTDG